MTDNGDVAYWRRESGAPSESWTVVVNESRGPDWYAYGGPVTQFLVDVLSRRIRVDVFPEDFPSEAVTFESRS